MYPEDRVLVGVINRKRDLAAALDEHWYRVPVARLKRVFDVEYVAFFESRSVRRVKSGIYHYAPVRGIELSKRRDLLPEEIDHPHADDIYYRVGLGDISEKTPPVLNPTGRTVTFLFTTWDRFSVAKTIRDLYSTDARFVDRVPDSSR